MNILLIDDDRTFRDGREYTLITSSRGAIEHFSNADGTAKDIFYDEVWLDFSLLGGDSIMDFIFFASRAAAKGNPLKVGCFVIHTSSWAGATLMGQVLSEAGYAHQRFDLDAQGDQKILSSM